MLLNFLRKLKKKTFHFIRCREEIILLGKGEKCSLSIEEEQLFAKNGMLTESCLIYQRINL